MLGQKSIVVNSIWGLVKVEDGQFQENFMVDGRSIKLFTTAVIIILFTVKPGQAFPSLTN